MAKQFALKDDKTEKAGLRILSKAESATSKTKRRVQRDGSGKSN